MNSLTTYINEKLIINKDIKNIETEVPEYTWEIGNKIQRIRFDKGIGPAGFSKHIDKMHAYQEKGSKPERLVATIKDNSKLFNRWFAAVKLEWLEAVDVFGKELEKRNVISMPELHSYILHNFNLGNKNSYNCYAKYLDYYDIKH